MDDDDITIPVPVMDEDATIVDPRFDSDATIADPRLLQPENRSNVTTLIPQQPAVVDPNPTTLVNPKRQTTARTLKPKRRAAGENVPVVAPVVQQEEDDSGLQSKPEVYADTYALAMFFLNDLKRLNYPSAQQYFANEIEPAIARNVPPYTEQRALREEVKKIVSSLYKVEDQNTIDEMIMDVLENRDYITKALAQGAFDDHMFFYEVAMQMREARLPAQYLAVAVSKIDQHKNYKRSRAAQQALLEMQKAMAQTAKKAKRLQDRNAAWEIEHQMLAQQAAAEIQARDAALAQTSAQLQFEQNTAAQLAANLQQQAANAEVALQQKDQQIAIEQERVGMVAQTAQIQAAALEADKQRLQQEAAEASARAQAIASQAEQLLQVKDASIAQKEAEMNQLRAEFNARMMEETVKSTELATRLTSELDATKARELELSKQLAEKAVEMAALAANKAAIEAKKEKAKKVKKEMEELQTDDLFAGIVVPSVDPNEERLKQKEAELAAKEAYLKQSLDQLNAEAAEVYAKIKKQQETVDLQKEWVDIARDLRVKLEEEHAAAIAKLTAELDALKAKCAATPAPAPAPVVTPAPAPAPAPAAAPAPSTPVVAAAVPVAVAPAAPAPAAAVAPAQAPTELQKAQAKADAHWAKHPRGKAQDLKYKNQKVVTTAAEYNPSKNDFPGVDLGTKRYVRWK